MYKKFTAFTMAEILLSLTIIGVVAAITLPSLTGNINERTWEAKRKALYSRMNQAIALMGNLNGYGIGANDQQTASNAAKTIVTDGLAKVLKINNICDYEHLNDCNIPTTIKNARNSTMSMPVRMHELNPQFSYSAGAGYVPKNTYAIAFETANGDSVLAFYNPYCTSKDVQPTILNTNHDTGYLTRQHICLNFIFDTNGKKGPNTAGKDIGVITALYANDSSVVMAIPYGLQWGSYANFFYSMNYCKNKGLRLPTLDEGISYYSSVYFYGLGTTEHERVFIWTTTSDTSNSDNAWVIGGFASAKYSYAKSEAHAVARCFK